MEVTSHELGLDSEVAASLTSARLGRCGVAPTFTAGMESCTGCDNVRVIRWRHIGNRPSASGVQVAQLVAQILKFVRGELVVIIQHVVMSRARGTEKSGVTLEVKVKLDWMNDLQINHGPGHAVANAITLLASHREEARVMTLLNDDQGDHGVVPGFEILASSLQVGHLGLEYLRELALGDAIAVEKDSLRLATAAILKEWSTGEGQRG